MSDFQEELIQRFRDYSNDEIIEKLKSGTLIELAQKVAKDELKARGMEFVPIDEIAAQASRAESIDVQDFETVAQFLNVADAQIVRGHLESEGIPVYLPDSHLGVANAFLLSGSSSIRLQVPRSLVLQATEIIRAIQDGQYSLEQVDKVNEPTFISEKLAPDAEEALLAFAQDPIWIKIWQGLINKTSRLASFNPFAAVLGITWFFFRKMYIFGIVVFFLDLLVLDVLGFVALLVLVRIPVGFLANIAYYKKAQRVIHKIQTLQLSKDKLIHQLKAKGGISIVGAMTAVVFMFAIRIMLRM